MSVAGPIVPRAAVSPIPVAFVAVACASMVVNLLALVGPLFMLQVYDRVLPSGSLSTLGALGVIVAVLYVFFTVLDGIRSRMLVRTGQFVSTGLAPAAFDRTLTPGRGHADGTDQPIKHLDQVGRFLSSSGPVALFDLPWLPLYLAVVFLFHPLLGWIATVGAAAIVALMVAADRFTARPTAGGRAHDARRAELADGAVSNGEAALAMGMIGALRRRWLAANQLYLTAQRQAADRIGGFGATIKGWRFALQSAILGTGAYLAVSGEISPGVMIAASIVSASARTALPRPAACLEVTAAAIAPPPSRAPKLLDVSFSLNVGDGLGVIGPSGAGKSTLARGLVGVWPLLRGSVRFDGAALDQWDRETLGRFLGYLPQDVQLIAGTVAQNIGRFAETRTDEAIIEAARLANAYELITELPDGFDTEVGPSGCALSAGQRQRIALARAFYGRPFLIVLDEPNANLDAAGEDALRNAVRTVRGRGAIVVVITHRPSALAVVDKILALEAGRQSAFGAKEEVLPMFLARRPPASDLKVVSGA